MKTCSKCNIEKELTEFGKQTHGKFGVRRICKICLKQYNKAWNKENTDKCRRYSREYGAKNKEGVNKKSSIWREKNKEYKKQKDKEYYLNNKNKIILKIKNWKNNNKEHTKKYMQNYLMLNKSKLYLKAKNYTQQKKDNNFIQTEFQKFVAQEMYDLAQIRKKQTGFDWHVDHIEPLSKGGKHAINNLQVVPALWNLSKGNRNKNVYKIGE